MQLKSIIGNKIFKLSKKSDSVNLRQEKLIFVLTFVDSICIIHFVDCESSWQKRAGVAELADAQASGACGR